MCTCRAVGLFVRKNVLGGTSFRDWRVKLFLLAENYVIGVDRLNFAGGSRGRRGLVQFL